MKFNICVFSKICWKNSSFIKSYKNNRYITWRPI